MDKNMTKKELEKKELQKKAEEEKNAIDRKIEALSQLDAKLANMEDGDSDEEPLPDDSLLAVLGNKSKYNVLVVGTTAKENAIVNSLKKSKYNIDIYCIGDNCNPGILPHCKDLVVTNKIHKIHKYIPQLQLDLIIIGSVEYMDNGIADLAETFDIPCFGPLSQYVKICNRAFAKDLLASKNLGEFNLQYQHFNHYDEEKITKCMQTFENFIVMGANYCSGKSIKQIGHELPTYESALEHCRKLIESDHHHGCIIEKANPRGDVFVTTSIVDGTSVYHLPITQSYKRLENNEKGYITTGMGSVSMDDHKMPFLTDDDIKVANNINNYVICALQNTMAVEGEYKGLLTSKWVKLEDGSLKVNEFGCDFNDPTSINLLSIMETDFMEICLRTVHSNLKFFDIAFRHEATCVSYAVPKGYPNTQYTEREIYVDEHKDDEILFGSVHQKPDSDMIQLLGSRAVAVVGIARNLTEARSKALSLHKCIHGPLEYRTDIGEHLLSSMSKKMTYETAGVNVDTNTQVVEQIETLVKSTHDDKVISIYGDFSALMKSGEGFYSFSMDGLGSKPKVMMQYMTPSDAYYNMGKDLVALCVNDILPQGTMPLAFLDSISCASIKVENVKDFIRGIADACKACNCRLLGGETCEMPNVYLPNTCEMMGCVIGYEKHAKKLINKEKMKASDVVYAWTSDGPHTNGFTLIKKILDETQIKEDMSTNDFMEFISWICGNHKLYFDELEAYKSLGINIKAMAHITGGGLIENPKRIIPDGLQMQLFNENIQNKMHKNFKKLQEYAQLDTHEMYKTFNCGIGMLVVVSWKDVEKIKKINTIKGWGNEIFAVGRIVDKPEKQDNLIFT